MHVCNTKLGLSHSEGVAFPLRVVGRTWQRVQSTPGIWLLPETPRVPLGLRCQREQLRPERPESRQLLTWHQAGFREVANACLFGFNQNVLVCQSVLKELTKAVVLSPERVLAVYGLSSGNGFTHQHCY